MIAHKINPRLIAAVSILVGTVIGAGILGIPYVVSQSGFLIGGIWILVLGGVMLLMNLYLGEIGLRTKKNHQLTGYAEKYLGKTGKRIMFAAAIFGFYAALLAYLIGEGESFSSLFFGHVNYALYFGIGFWLVLTWFIYQGYDALKKGESIGVIVMLLLIVGIAIGFAPDVSMENLSYINYGNLFVPFGVILFALLGFSALPELEKILGKEKKLMKKAIIWGTLIPVVMYFVFALVVVGFLGIGINEIATLSLGKFFVVLGIFTMFTSFLALSFALRDMLMWDYKIPKFKAWIVTAIVPLILYLLIMFFKFASFSMILSIGGTVSGGLMGILILLMIKNAKKNGDEKPAYEIPYMLGLIVLFILLFVAGIVFDLWHFFV
ncbi:MAG: amino acid permease [Nanoarchaeota archaeon]|nr:amino acid permease [Nanoarchaeota archaeon]